MIFRKQTPAEHLLYADTELEKIEIKESKILVYAVGFDESPFIVCFTNAKLLQKTKDGFPENVVDGQILKLKNKSKRILLYDDEKNIILKIEYNENKFV